MIIGLGNDLVDIRRIAKLLQKHPQRFIKRVFSQFEMNQAPKNPELLASYYAKRFAAKEAFVKALGLGFRKGIEFNQISVIRNQYGKPEVIVSGAARVELQKHAAKFCTDFRDDKIKLHLSLSDEIPYACAVVIIEL